MRSIVRIAFGTQWKALNPHFSPAFYCGGGSRHVYCVALCRAPRHTVEYACGALGRAPCIHARLRRLATKSGEKCGLGLRDRTVESHRCNQDHSVLTVSANRSFLVPTSQKSRDFGDANLLLVQ
jgi:hypothetical protein